MSGILETTADSAAISKAGTPPGLYVCNEPLQNCFNKMQNLYHPKEIACGTNPVQKQIVNKNTHVCVPPGPARFRHMKSYSGYAEI